nr:unnamed protein product [Spirometra erinaceieuropaei]
MNKAGQLQEANLAPNSLQEKETQIYFVSSKEPGNIYYRRPLPTLLHSNTCHYLARIPTDGQAFHLDSNKKATIVSKDNGSGSMSIHDVIVKKVSARPHAGSKPTTTNDSSASNLRKIISKDHFNQHLGANCVEEWKDEKKTAPTIKETASSSLSSDKRIKKTPYERILECLDSNWTNTQDAKYNFFDSSNTLRRYVLRETLGTGTFSKVQLATHMMTKENVAIKIIDKTKVDAATRRLISREMMVLDKLHHPNIIRLYEVKIPQRISESASSLIRELLCKNPLNRPKAAKIISHATHPSSSLRPASVSGVQPGVKSHTIDSESWLAGQVFPKAYPCFRISPNCDFQRPQGRYPMPTRTSDSASRLSLTILDTKSPSADIEALDKTTNRLSVPSRDDIFDDGRGSDVSARSSLLPDAIVYHSEAEAARLLLHMGISPEQMDVARCLEARSSITGAYRILLHRLHRLRRLSNLVVSGQEKSTPSEFVNKSVINTGAGNTTFNESLIETAGQQDTTLEREYNQLEWRQRRVCSLL